jgi:uncharacterized membrane protein YqhA
MLRAAYALRYVMLVGSVAAGTGALLMFWEAATKLGNALRAILGSHDSGKAVIASVMGATDACLFGIVLTFFAYAIAFGFVVQLDGAARDRLPRWMRVESVSELKHALVEVILVYLVVDFATDIAEAEVHLTWQTLVMPAAILMIAAAFRLMSGAKAEHAGSHPVRSGSSGGWQPDTSHR